MPDRRCVGCGVSRPKSDLLRFVQGAEGLVPDPDARLPGRGAYLCRRRDCAERALRGGGFQRSFRGPVSNPEKVLDYFDQWPRSESTR